MATVHSFPPVARADARVLILGSMPGRKSLEEQQYYAHPRNAFWRIAGTLFNFDPRSSYGLRKTALIESGVALWDVMAQCTRPSSLDSDIVESTIVANDFSGFFVRHHGIRAVYFNGIKAAQAYRKYVESGLTSGSGLQTRRLPSTSPAHAAMSYIEKLEAWRTAISTDCRLGSV